MAKKYHGYGENLEKGTMGKSNVVKKKKKMASRQDRHQISTRLVLKVVVRQRDFKRKNDLCYPLSSAWFVRYKENVRGSRGGAQVYL